MPTTKITIYKGCTPEDTSWWTEKDWVDHKKYVEELKSKGEYLQSEEIEVSYPEGAFDKLTAPPLPEGQSYFSNFGVLIPKGPTQ